MHGVDLPLYSIMQSAENLVVGDKEIRKKCRGARRRYVATLYSDFRT